MDTDQIQRVLDSYSIGKLIKSYRLDDINYSDKFSKIPVYRFLIETTHGLFLLLGSNEDKFQYSWWASQENSFSKKLKRLKKQAGLQSAKVMKTQPHKTDTDHKFNQRFMLFNL
ncbi:hypothetical protein A2313_00990 [Candidatus Roizmanbacteria bacterium RIFOXYB2_FULL_41_10]|uniref:Uncharacterized protein n=1 Tax=Candidatus Roizmanbacteria bacterium RIFOXYA1_FULL_41_12 TaxID=1802082 RepID=A0A1F7KFD6_9BACT|nr:MAG: hypothetical protein A2209_01040 [Candidatus Roizmanbacteria bacterium RIFOXYA1_FULL_41_12]OGK67813.1 MAG: hypothetical protein A2262_03920 [Candidatus Roizmanbacteria bacterium RIFOXYA2_FULL_41_8]OGK69340.1 MAG: hypothetical protein A2313_00990 [Candidatus Roizmanbacteria bacterium RIFOXYB2_FULL_41_10]OGK71140.1 MAG: hypothetical protein A2403_02920 [Candidatus Roizmanbacteria bacterium RIFOXYC1_FULL_41_16]OGK74855.1 MAG: hypothetical protein A2575_00735 [Candidatus Roizmanbacteria bac